MTVPPPVRSRRLVFLGTPDVAVPPLHALLDAGFDVPLVVSRPDRRRGRGSATSPSPVKAAALERGITVTDRLDDAAEVGADLGVVVAFGRIIGTAVLDRLPMINVHFSLLPRWRGAAPVERAILAGDDRTGVCVMEVVEALDAGGVHARAEIPIAPDTTADALRRDLSLRGAELLTATLEAGLGPPEPQEGEVTYAEKISPRDLRIAWEAPAAAAMAKTRVGGAWTTRAGTRLGVHRAIPGPDGVDLAPGRLHLDDGDVLVGTGDRALRLVEVQPEGKGRLDAGAWANGARLVLGERLGQ